MDGSSSTVPNASPDAEITDDLGNLLADPAAEQTKKKSRRGRRGNGGNSGNSGNSGGGGGGSGDERPNQKRRCVSTACVACRRRKSKCNGALPSCSACQSVYGTDCIYDPNSDHRRKGVYREKLNTVKARDSTLQIIVEAILSADDDDVVALVRKIRECGSIDAAAEAIQKQDFTAASAAAAAAAAASAGGVCGGVGGGVSGGGSGSGGGGGVASGAGIGATTAELADLDSLGESDAGGQLLVDGETELARKMGELRLENGSVRFIGGTSHLIYLGDPVMTPSEPESDSSFHGGNPVTSWTTVTNDPKLIIHLMNMYFNWHYPYFTTLSKHLFYRDFLAGKHGLPNNAPVYCSSLLVNTMLALGCHFTSIPEAYAVPGDNRTRGDHFFAEARRLTMENGAHEIPQLTTVQALALMSVREAGCGHEAKGWVYSGMSFRMAQDIGLNLDVEGLAAGQDALTDQDVDARRITFWGCFLFDKCWSNYMGRIPQIPKNTYNVPKFDVFPDEDAEMWSPWTDAGLDQSVQQPARTRAVALQLSRLCEISSEILLFFYHPNHFGRSNDKSAELKKLSELHRHLEAWKAGLPREFEPKEGQLPNVILMHMFYHLQYIHLFRPFLKYKPAASPLPAHVSPRRICTANAVAISKLMRLYKKVYNLRQICNIAVYMVHSACTIHMLNLPDKTARRDIIHGVKHLEEIAEDWPCARRNLAILGVLAQKWKVDLPDEANLVLRRTNDKYGPLVSPDLASPRRKHTGTGTGTGAGSSGSGSGSGSGMGAASSSSPATLSNTPSPNAGGSERQFTPISQYATLPPSPPPPPLPDLVHAGMSTDSMLAMSAGPTQSLGSIGSAQMGPEPGPGPGTSNMNPWPVSTASRPVRSYVPVYTGPGSGSGQSPPPPHSTPADRNVSPGSSSYALDGQDWYIKDGMNWQQNFEAWGGLGAAGAGLQQVGGVDTTTGVSAAAAAAAAAAVAAATAGGGGGGAGADPSVFVFNGLGGDALDFNFDTFNATSALDHLPELE